MSDRIDDRDQPIHLEQTRRDVSRRLFIRTAVGAPVAVSVAANATHLDTRALNHVGTLQALKSSPISAKYVCYENSVFGWSSIGAPFLCDDDAVVESNLVPSSVGAWVRLGRPTENFQLLGDNSDLRTVIEKLREETSVLDFIPFEEHEKIRAGTSRYDCSMAFQNAIDSAWTIFVPDGTYLIGDTIREATNAGARTIIGQSRLHTKVVATSELAKRGAPLFWFGNSSGHGNYRLTFNSLCLNGAGSKADEIGGATGLRAHECGTSAIGDLYITRCKVAIEAIGCIGSTFGGSKSEIHSCGKGIWFTAPKAGRPSSPDDVGITANKLSLRPNANHVSNIWFSSVGRPLRVAGGLTHVDQIVFQSCGDGRYADLLHIMKANESYDYGGGPTVSNLWCEGGNYRSVVRIEDTRDARIRKAFLSGAGPTSEQGILVLRSIGCRIDDTSARGAWGRQPMEGRDKNYWLYVDSSSTSGIFGPFYFTPNSCSYFIDRTRGSHNHVIIDNHRSDKSSIGIIVGPIQISGQQIKKDPAVKDPVALEIQDFSFSGVFYVGSNGAEPGLVNAADGFQVAGEPVLGPRTQAIYDATGGSVIDVEARAAVNAILKSLRKHGLISS